LLVIKLVVSINVAANRLSDASQYLQSKLSESLKDELIREALTVFFDGYYEVCVKLWLCHIDLLFALHKVYHFLLLCFNEPILCTLYLIKIKLNSLPQFEDAYRELKRLSKIFEAIQAAESLEPSNDNVAQQSASLLDEDAMDIDEPQKKPSDSSNTDTDREFRMTPKRTKYQVYPSSFFSFQGFH
jgi:hypothetical protein